MLFSPLVLSPPSPELWLQGLCLNSGGLGDLSSGSNQPGGMQTFPPPRKLSWGSLFLHCWLLTWHLGSTWFLNWGCFIHSGFFNGRVGGGWPGTHMNGCLGLVFQKSLWWGYSVQDSIIEEGDIWLHHFPQLKDAPHQKAWLAQCGLVGFFCPVLGTWA